MWSDRTIEPYTGGASRLDHEPVLQEYRIRAYWLVQTGSEDASLDSDPLGLRGLERLSTGSEFRAFESLTQLSGPKTPDKHKDPTNHGFWNRPCLGPSQIIIILLLTWLFGSLTLALPSVEECLSSLKGVVSVWSGELRPAAHMAFRGLIEEEKDYRHSVSSMHT